ncbi:MAG: RibD family protein, partial [Geminicoccaceae bacterium]
ADAIVVGAGTVRHDDPQLTTRLVAGPSPVRVVLDSRRRLGAGYRLFQEGPPTLVLCAAGAADGARLGHAEIVPVETADGSAAPAAVLDALRARGLRRVFVEGGGVTVSRFLFGGCLDILEICVSPLILGSGRPGLAGPAPQRTDEALRLDGCRAIPMGADMLFHQKLRPA